MGGLGATEILLIILVALLLFGAGRIADIGKGLGEGIRNFKKGLKDDGAGADTPLASGKDRPFGELDKPDPVEADSDRSSEPPAKKPAERSDDA